MVFAAIGRVRAGAGLPHLQRGAPGAVLPLRPEAAGVLQRPRGPVPGKRTSTKLKKKMNPVTVLNELSLSWLQI